jgi:hypothetical protein
MAKSTGDDQKEQWWVVLHSAVDHFYQGQVINLAHLRGSTGREIDARHIERLERLGAIAPVDSEQAKALQATLGPDAVTPEGTPVSAPVPEPTPDITKTAAAATPPVAS